jgi:hypothetical protein
LAFFNAALNATMSPDPAQRSTLEEVREYLEALLEVEDEETFSTPEFEEPPAEENLNAEEALAHFNAFSRDTEEEEKQEKEREEKEALKTTPEKPNKKIEKEEEEAPEEAPPIKDPKDWMKILWKAGQISSGVVVVLMLFFIWIWNIKPHLLPPAWLEAQGPAPQELTSGDPTTLPDYNSIVESLNSKKGRLRKCDLKQDSLSVMVVVEPNGSVRAAGTSYLPKNQRHCVRRKLLGMVLKRRSRIKSVRVRTTVLF